MNSVSLQKWEIKQMQQITSSDNRDMKCFISKVLKHFAFNILSVLFSKLCPWFNNLSRKKMFYFSFVLMSELSQN